MLEWVIIAEDVGKKLITFLSDRLGDQYSAKSLKRALETNCCQVNGKTERFASIVLKKRDHVCFNPELLPKAIESTKMDFSRILFDDKDLLVYNKPPGLSCDAQGILKDLQNYSPHLQLIHRLDKETSGVLLLAKNQTLLTHMITLFKEGKVEKTYFALVDGYFTEKKGTIQNYLGKKSFFQGQTIWGSVPEQKGLFAHTDWQVIKQGKSAALIECYPKTGKTHQIRVHMAEMGHPILGDTQYGKNAVCPYHAPRCLLHAAEISFGYLGEKVTFKAPVPSDFAFAQKQLLK